ncbi:hypothetical protein BJ992_003610 [Sphaerisporangium rubeum]|uniref:Uncharacterized protein n=2 Tax=Sphaerisporangium rubeum TaxID=321317 RepID=A0A7X0IFA4_9ACTN|nr:hypothetical protein [Sphaerisporangium rubeum]
MSGGHVDAGHMDSGHGNVSRYGAGPGHAFVMAVCFAVAAYVLSRVAAAGILAGFLLWFLGAAVLHDVVLLPLYTGLFHGLRVVVRRGRAVTAPRSAPPVRRGRRRGWCRRR